MHAPTELTQYITPDGVVLDLDVPAHVGKWVVSQSGWGAPPIDYITQRGPFQDGATVKDFFLSPRVLQLLIRANFCDRNGFWAGRSDLLNHLRPNRQVTPTAAVPGRLRRILSTGQVRDLDVFITEGPRFEPQTAGSWDEWSYQEVLRFIAHNPVVYDPAEVEAALTIVLDAELVFPITFPIEFGAGDIDSALNIDYVGTWDSFPVITLTGPIENPAISNDTTGEKIEFDTNVALGQIITIDLAYGAKTVIDDSGANLIGTLTSDSDLATWHIAPSPLAAGPPAGRNVIRLTGRNATGATALVLTFNTRYFGI